MGGNILTNEEIGLKAAGNGMITIINRHALAEMGEVETEVEVDTPGATVELHKVVNDEVHQGAVQAKLDF